MFKFSRFIVELRQCRKLFEFVKFNMRGSNTTQSLNAYTLKLAEISLMAKLMGCKNEIYVFQIH